MGRISGPTPRTGLVLGGHEQKVHVHHRSCPKSHRLHRLLPSGDGRQRHLQVHLLIHDLTSPTSQTCPPLQSRPRAQ